MSTLINRLDLNLLRVFDAVMEERSVLRAGQRICLSQSAVSHALARLREMIGDELFVRTTTGMQPTARALQMAPLIREAWKSLEVAIELPRFDPRSSTRCFTVAVSDFVSTVVVPDLLGLLKREAPLVDLALRSDNGLDLIEQLDLGRIDVAVGAFTEIPDRYRASPLFSCDDVLIVHRSRRLGRLTRDTLATLSIATVSMHGGGGGADRFVSARGLGRRSEMFDRLALERAFRGSKRKPRLTLSLAHFLAVPSLLEDGQLAAIVPRPLAAVLARVHPLSMHELPYGTAVTDVVVLWSERSLGDAAQDWLRRMLTEATTSLRPTAIDTARTTLTLPTASLPRIAVGARAERRSAAACSSGP
ncbi:LysR family transcriptional regulator [Bradyrhizobium liaoningense]|uniref:LysR family transcriptional regulator n=1 Tax=Bradyrhizobium liaoningense TaxID=43992 RepID=UPI001BAD896D|nr:LysR family transcriptional regulator [Bradyrhizobium liaoningense]MBR0816619.1 LysR family transcriptional regulator [Bradyrhizobium liaoningense]